MATPRNSKKFSNAFNCLFCGRTVHNADGKASGMLILYASPREFTGKSDLFFSTGIAYLPLSGFSPAYDDGISCKTSSWGHRAISSAAALNGQRNCRAGDLRQVVQRTMGRHQSPCRAPAQCPIKCACFRRSTGASYGMKTTGDIGTYEVVLSLYRASSMP